MTRTVLARYDGRVIVPDDALELPAGQRLRIEIEAVEADAPPFADMSQLAADLPDAPSDLASQHDHYIYGTPKQ